jgi:hypothetical protein
MTFPAGGIATTHLDSGSDAGDPAAARADLLALAQQFNALCAHVSSFQQGLLALATAADVRAALGLSRAHGGLISGSNNASGSGSVVAWPSGATQTATGAVSVTPASGRIGVTADGLYLLSVYCSHIITNTDPRQRLFEFIDDSGVRLGSLLLCPVSAGGVISAGGCMVSAVPLTSGSGVRVVSSIAGTSDSSATYAAALNFTVSKIST